MLKTIEIAKQIFYCGVNDRTKHLFEALWPLPYGVSYNSYLVVDSQIALIDTVEADFSTRFAENICEVIGDRSIDYLVINHMEPDHSSSIGFIKNLYPKIKVVGNCKTLDMIRGYYGICDNLVEVKDGEELSLGATTLSFHITPMVHWPETMMTYCSETCTLFSGDAFGCFGALNGGVKDADMDTEMYWNEMRRYYSNIVGKYGAMVQRAMQKLSCLKVDTVCSTHGPVWHEQLVKVMNLYDRLSRYDADNGVVIVYGSMYGNTEQAAEQLARELSEKGVKNIVMHNLSVSNTSFVLSDIFRYRALIIGSPTYNGELFPAVESLTRAIASRGVKNRIFGCFGGFTWAGTAVKKLAAFGEQMGWEQAESLEFKQGYAKDKLASCSSLAQSVASKLNEAR